MEWAIYYIYGLNPRFGWKTLVVRGLVGWRSQQLDMSSRSKCKHIISRQMFTSLHLCSMFMLSAGHHESGSASLHGRPSPQRRLPRSSRHLLQAPSHGPCRVLRPSHWTGHGPRVSPHRRPFSTVSKFFGPPPA